MITCISYTGSAFRAYFGLAVGCTGEDWFGIAVCYWAIGLGIDLHIIIISGVQGSYSGYMYCSWVQLQ